MPINAKKLYTPLLRAKNGEFRGLRQLAPDIADRIRPYFVMPPPKEPDPEKRRVLTRDEILYGTGRRLAEAWPLREAYLDARYLFSEFGDAEAVDWLPAIFRSARNANAHPIPAATIEDILGQRRRAFAKLLRDHSPIHLALRITLDEVDSDLSDRIDAVMRQLTLDPSNCVVVLDLSGADLSEPEIVGGVLEGALDEIQDIALWKEVIFQATHYPEKNPADAGSHVLVPRNEWLVWESAVGFGADVPDHLIFGDFCADSAKFIFSSGGRPIPHYRYATPDNWLVVRGMQAEKLDGVMQDVSDRIVTSGHFAGRGFSSADEYIFASSHGAAGPGNATTWRGINTTHHITRVVQDIGRAKGIAFQERGTREETSQADLFEDADDLPKK